MLQKKRNVVLILIAVIMNNEKRRKIGKKRIGDVCIIKVGEKVSARRVEKLVRRYDAFFCAENSGFTGGTNAVPFAKMLLADEFLSYVLSLPKGAEVGVFGGDEDDVEALIPAVRHCKRVFLINCAARDGFFEECMCRFGTAPVPLTGKVGTLDAAVCFEGNGQSKHSFSLEKAAELTPDLRFSEELSDIPFTPLDRIRLAALLYPADRFVWQPKVLENCLS